MRLKEAFEAIINITLKASLSTEFWVDTLLITPEHTDIHIFYRHEAGLQKSSISRDQAPYVRQYQILFLISLELSCPLD